MGWARHRDRGLLLQSGLYVLLACLHHLRPHGVCAPVLVEEFQAFFVGERAASLLGDLGEMGQCDFGDDFFSLPLFWHGEFTPSLWSKGSAEADHEVVPTVTKRCDERHKQMWAEIDVTRFVSGYRFSHT